MVAAVMVASRSKEARVAAVATQDHVPFHPLADAFPLIEGVEFNQLVADIKANGLIEPIVLLDGRILDGRNRYRACMAAGVEPRFTRFRGDDPAAFVGSANIHRRHLTADDKRDLIAKLLKAQPEKSDRQIARAVKASPTTVGTVRAKMEAVGDVSRLDTSIDTKGRQQPRKRKATPQADRRRRKDNRRDLARQQHAAAEDRRREHAEAVARELIQEHGETTVRRIVEALRSPYVDEELVRLLAKGRISGGGTAISSGTTNPPDTVTPSRPDPWTDLDIPASLRRVPLVADGGRA
jgi:ParB-like chromosome segregation protein Spo0J